jgi:sugar phosphate isomerase/epimerase
MLVSTQTEYLAEKFSQECAIRMLADAGYEAFDLSLFSMINDEDPLNGDDYRAKAEQLRKTADACGIVCNQAHAPFPSSQADETFNKKMFSRIVRAMEIASILGAKHIVVHPVQHLYYPENVRALRDMNRAFYRALEPYCEAFGIQVALENMFQGDPRRHVLIESTCNSPDEFCDYVDALPAEHFTACLDIGHCGLVGQDAANFIRALGHDRLCALHVHDNDYHHDLHTLPLMGALDWDVITTALADIRYTGDITLEADGFLTRLPEGALSGAVHLMCTVAKHLRDEVVRKMSAKALQG